MQRHTRQRVEPGLFTIADTLAAIIFHVCAIDYALHAAMPLRRHAAFITPFSPLPYAYHALLPLHAAATPATLMLSLAIA